VKRKLLNYPVTVDDFIFISIGISKEIIFKVISMKPDEVCQIKMDTILTINEETIEDYDNGKVYITFDVIGGLKSEIDEVRNIFELALIKKLNIDIPRGILLVGPPGTGKTLLSRAIANTYEYNFISIVSPEIIQKYRGDSEKKLRDIFQEANEKAPSIIFFDHIDAIATKIQEEVSENYNYTEHRIVTQLLGLMDGLLPNKDVIVLATTHRLDLIEPALLRPGRFDKIIHLSLPDLHSRIEIYEIHTRNLHLDDDVSLEELAELSNNFTGADIKVVCQFATINAAKRTIPDIGSENKEISDEEIEKIVINKQDFLSTINEVAERIDSIPCD
jgi:transitional endoplasmic reticulum ATPase